jgi:hypothetical protein
MEENRRREEGRRGERERERERRGKAKRERTEQREDRRAAKRASQPTLCTESRKTAATTDCYGGDWFPHT